MSFKFSVRVIEMRIVYGLILVMLSSSAFSEGVAVLPIATLLDKNNEVVAPIVGFEAVNVPIIRLVDAGLNLPIFLGVLDNHHLRGWYPYTYFSEDNCTGDVYYHSHFDNTTGFPSMTGYNYSVAKIDGVQWLFRSDLSVEREEITFKSQYILDQCYPNSGMEPLRPAVPIMNLDAAHPPPYRMTRYPN